MEKSFIITIDTEGDNLWNWEIGKEICSENSLYLPRFQNLCNDFGFKPVYLTNYEMAMDKRFVKFAKATADQNKCEIGMHLHAYNNPPFFDLNVAYNKNFPYLIEYPPEVMEEKIANITKVLQETFERKIVSHRAGRWATNELYFSHLKKYGYTIDCSVTPLVDWSSTKGATADSSGSDYRKSPSEPFFIADGILEVPVTTRTIRKSFVEHPTGLKDFARIIKHNMLGQTIWLRPNGNNLKEMQYLIQQEQKNDSSDYLMFMIHSSELMPGGSPTFKSEEDIENLYSHLKVIFKQLSSYCEGKTLSEYVEEKYKQ